MIDIIHYAVVRCNNPDAIKELVLAIRKKDVEQCKEWKYGDKEIIFFLTNDNNFFGETEQVSKDFPEDVFDCETSSDYNPSDGCASEFRNGEFKYLGLHAVYSFSPMHLGNEEDETGIYKKAATLFRRLDTVVPSGIDGHVRINWYEEEICYKFSYDGADGTEYKVEATKEERGASVSLKVYKYLREEGWVEIISGEEAIRPFLAENFWMGKVG